MTEITCIRVYFYSWSRYDDNIWQTCIYNIFKFCLITGLNLSFGLVGQVCRAWPGESFAYYSLILLLKGSASSVGEVGQFEGLQK